MKTEDLKALAQKIVSEARQLIAAHTDQPDAPVNYACVFSQSPDEYEELLEVTRQFGPIVEETAMGPVFHITAISTEAGPLRLLKIRRPDSKRPERGDADFTVSDYANFKETYLDKPGFGIIKRENMEMLELIDPAFNVLAYYSHPTLAEVLKLNVDESSGSGNT
jgi:hypothetical protein